jgi:hypothetical protein
MLVDSNLDLKFAVRTLPGRWRRHRGNVWGEKAGIAQFVLTDELPDGSMMGVYIEWINGENGEPPQWCFFSSRGHLTREAWFPDPARNQPKNRVNSIACELSFTITRATRTKST